MKVRFWKKILAVILSLLLTSGCIPAESFAGLFGNVVTAYADEGEGVGTKYVHVLVTGENEVQVPGGDTVHCIFTPENDGYYGFCTEDPNEEGDPYTELTYEGSSIADNDDYYDYDSVFYVFLQSGRTYDFSLMNRSDEDITYSVTIQFFPIQELEEGENIIKTWYEEWRECIFTPGDTGTYRFRLVDFSNEDLYAELYYNSSTIADDSNYDDDNICFTAELEKGKQYSFHMQTYGTEGETFTLAIEKIDIFSITIDDNLENGTIDVSVSEATQGETVSLEVDPDSDYYLSKLTVTNDTTGEEIPVTDYEFVMPASSVTISAEFSEIPTSIELGENILPVTGSRNYYSFIPEKTGRYWFEQDSADCYVSQALYSGYGLDDKYYALLYAGVEYTFETYDDNSFGSYCVTVEYEPLDEVVLGENIVSTQRYVSPDDESESIEVCTFTPDETGLYRFWTVMGDDHDPQAELYGEYGCIADDDDSGGNYDFNFSVNLEEGVTYLLLVRDLPDELNKIVVHIDYAEHKIVVDDNLEHGTIEASASQAEAGQYISLTATPDEDYYVSKWIVKDADGNDVPVYYNEFSMPASDVTVSAEFAEPVLQVGENPIVLLSDDLEVYTFTPSETGKYTIYSENGYLDFIGLYNGENEVASSGGYNFNFSAVLEAGVEYELELTPYGPSNFTVWIDAADYKVVVDENTENGTIEVSVDRSDEGETVQLSGTPEDGYCVSKWIVKDADGNDVPVYYNEFSMPASDVTVSAEFAEPVLQVGENPIVLLSDDLEVYTFTPSETGKYTIYSENGYLEIIGLYAGNEEVASSGGYDFNFSAVLEAGVEYELELTACGPSNFTVGIQAPAYRVSVDESTVNGTIMSDVDLADQWDDVHLTASPEDGYRLAQWIVKDSSGTSVVVSNDTFTMPADNVSVSAIFEEPVLHMGNNYVMTQSGEDSIYSFTPEKSAKYHFYFEGGDDVGDAIGWLNDGENQLAYDNGDNNGFSFEVILVAGKEYTFGIEECYGRAMNSAVCIETVELPQLEIGEISVTTKKSDWVEYAFYPVEDGKYRFYSNLEGTRRDPKAELYGEEGYINSGDNENGNNFRFTVDLKAGQLYILKIMDAQSRVATFPVGVEVAGFRVSIDENQEHGSVVVPEDLVEDGDTVTLEASSNSNRYYFYRFIVTDETGTEITVDGNEFVMPKSNVTVLAEFIEKPDSIHNGENILPSLSDNELNYSFIPLDTGTYRFYSMDNDSGDPQAWLYDGTNNIAYDDDNGENLHFDFSIDLTAGNKYVFRLQSRANNCYKVMVEAPYYDITVDDGIINGTVEASAEKAFKGDTIVLNVVPDEGYAVKSVSINGEVLAIGEDGYSFEMPGEDVIVSAEFEDTRNILNSTNITLGGELGLNFYLTVPDFAVNNGATIKMDGPAGEKDVVLTDLTKDSKGRYPVTYKIKAIYMDQSVTLKLVDSDGTALPLVNTNGDAIENNTVEYSIYDYVEQAKRIKAEDDSAITDANMRIINTMYTYGAYSVKWKFDTDVPDDVESLPAISAEDLLEFKLETDGTSDSITLTGASLLLDSNTKFRLYFKASDAIGNHFINLGDTQLLAKKTKTKGKYYVDIENIGARKLENDYTVTFDDSYSVTVSAMTYVYNFLKSGMEDENLENLLRALYAYAEAAKQ